MSIANIAHKFLVNFVDAEKAHDIGKWAMKKKLFAPGRYVMEGGFDLFGFDLDNPLGLAAGFDKNGELVDVARDYGFGYVEVGSVTHNGGPGNERPRLFRLEDGSLLNRMGLNCDPTEVIAQRLLSAQNPYAINIAKTHDPNIMGDRAIDDIIGSYKLIIEHLEPTDNVIYVVFNLSCPNTTEGKTFEDPAALKELHSAIMEVKGSRPVLYKFSPTLKFQDLRSLIEIVDEKADGYVDGNTKPYNHPAFGKGGASGPQVRKLAKETVMNARLVTQKPIIGVGGIFTGRDAHAIEKSGADAGFQVYNGFVYGSPHSGPEFARHLLNEYIKEKEDN